MVNTPYGVGARLDGYEIRTAAVAKGVTSITTVQGLAAAAITGGITSFITTPLDLIKTKLMMQSTSAGGQYSGVMDALTRYVLPPLTTHHGKPQF